MKQDLVNSLIEMFSAESLRLIIQSNFGVDVSAHLPADIASAIQLATGLANVLESRDDSFQRTFFNALREARPRLHGEIDALEARWLAALSAQRAKMHRASPFGWLPEETLRQVYRTAIAAGLAQSPEALTVGIDPAYIASFATSGPANARMHTMLQRMNTVRRLVDGTVPLAKWLDNAEMLTLGQEAADVFVTARKQMGDDAV